MRKNTNLIIQALGYLRPYWFLAVFFILLSFLSVVFDGISLSMVIPIIQNIITGSFDIHSQSGFLSMIIKSLFSFFPIDKPHFILIVIFFLFLLKNLCLWASSYVSRWLQYKTRWKLVSEIFNQIFDLEYGYITDKRTGEIYSWMELESSRASYSLYLILQLIANIGIVVLYSLFMLMVSWKITLVVSMPLIILVLVMRRLTVGLRSIGERVSESGRDIFSYWVEILFAQRTVRLFRNYEFERFRHEGFWKRFNKLAMNRYIILDMLNPLSEAIVMFVFTIAMIVAFPLIIAKKAHIFPVLLIFIYILKLLQLQINKINNLRAELSSDLPAVQVITEVLSKDNKPYIISGRERFTELKEGISFKDVSFRYPKNNDYALKGISLHILKGKVIALVGSSGAGKSTLVDLIFRLYDPQEGEIFVDGKRLKDLDLADWQSRIGFVSQDTFIFNATLWDNIAYGRLDANRDEIIEVAKKAYAHDFITALPSGYDTLLGDRGFKLSGGERQRIAIARVILKSPDILIFDEATSALDTESEKKVQDAIYELSRNCTVLIIAHRLSTIEHADQLIVLEQGKIVEVGTHKELLEKNKKYARLHALQYRSAYKKYSDDLSER